MSKFYFKRVVGAYSMSSRKQPDFLELKVISFVSYATIPGFGPGYVNTSAGLTKSKGARKWWKTSRRSRQLHANIFVENRMLGSAKVASANWENHENNDGSLEATVRSACQRDFLVATVRGLVGRKSSQLHGWCECDVVVNTTTNWLLRRVCVHRDQQRANQQ
jgi:hypothetical protein